MLKALCSLYSIYSFSVKLPTQMILFNTNGQCLRNLYLYSVFYFFPLFSPRTSDTCISHWIYCQLPSWVHFCVNYKPVDSQLQIYLSVHSMCCNAGTVLCKHYFCFANCLSLSIGGTTGERKDLLLLCFLFTFVSSEVPVNLSLKTFFGPETYIVFWSSS